MDYKRITKDLSEKLTLWGAFRVKVWLDEQVKKGRVNSQYLTLLKDWETALQEIYPGNWDIHTVVYKAVYRDSRGRLGNRFKIYFQPIVRFPEFTITNSKKNTHKIKDLYIKIPFNEVTGDGASICQIEGIRGKLTVEEFSSNYLHSHLSAVETELYDMKFRPFCVGTGEIVQLMQMLSSKFDLDLFRLFLHQLKVVAEWESLEGTPYRRMTNIFNRVDNELESFVSYEELIGWSNNIIDEIQRNKVAKFNWILKNNKPFIVDDETLEDGLKCFGPTLNTYREVSFYKDEAGKYYPTTTAIPKLKDLAGKYISFRGKKIPFEIENLPEEEVQKKQLTTKFYLHPLIKNYVKRHFEQKALLHQTRRGFTERLETKSGNATKDTSPS